MKDKAFLARMQFQGKIGNWTGMGAGHVRGYPGLTHTALPISEYIPKCHVYVEPFAGLGRVAKFVDASMKILNDKSDYAFKYLQAHFPKAQVECDDFEFCINFFDGPNTFFLIDPPWSKTEYEEGCRERAFIDRTPKEYYDKIFELLPTLKGNWFVCGNKDNKRLLDQNYHNHLFKSKKKIMGGNISTLVMSNRPFFRYNQECLTVEKNGSTIGVNN